MTQEHVLRDFETLPRPAQQSVLEFIAFLHARYDGKPLNDVGHRPDLKEEPFVGMWRDRTGMADSTGWVRTARAREWGREGGRTDRS